MRVAAMEFIWQLMLTDNEHFASHKKGTITPRQFKIANFTIGKNCMDEVSQWLEKFRMGAAPYRYIDPEGFMAGVRKLYTPTIPNTNVHCECIEEDATRNNLDEDDIHRKRLQIQELLKLQIQIRRNGLSFGGFYPGLNYFDRIKAMLDNYDMLLDQLDTILAKKGAQSPEHSESEYESGDDSDYARPYLSPPQQQAQGQEMAESSQL
jgi:hypothetical protein